jgi:hypothetical protein
MRQRLKLLADAPEIASADCVSLAMTWRKCFGLEFASEDKLRCFRGVNRPRWTAHPIARMRECLFDGRFMAQSGIIEGGHKALPYNSCTGERWNPGMWIKRGRHQYVAPSYSQSRASLLWVDLPRSNVVSPPSYGTGEGKVSKTVWRIHGVRVFTAS